MLELYKTKSKLERTYEWELSYTTYHQTKSSNKQRIVISPEIAEINIC